MCVLILQPAGKELSREDAMTLWRVNPDGGGFAFVDNHGEFLVKKFMRFDDWWSHYRGYMGNYNDRPWILHMRIATHGTVDLDNVHPFPITDKLIGGHNGIIHTVPDYKDGRSDTRVFFEEVIAHFPEDWLDREAMVSVVEDTIGQSKLAFLSTSEKLDYSYYILNENKGDWRDGMWFSNLYGLDWGSRKKSSGTVLVRPTGWGYEDDDVWETPASVHYDSALRTAGFSTGYYNKRYEQVEFFKLGNIATLLQRDNGTILLADELEAAWKDFRDQLNIHSDLAWMAGTGAVCLRCGDPLDVNWVVCGCADLACPLHGELAISCLEEHDTTAEFPAVVNFKDKDQVFFEYFQELILEFWNAFDPHSTYEETKESEVLDGATETV